jgi:hypothetical protein
MGKRIVIGAAVLAVLSFILAAVAPDVYNNIINGLVDMLRWIGGKAND